MRLRPGSARRQTKEKSGRSTSLGVIYETGESVPQDYKKAVVWFRKAAEQGYANAQNDLGSMFLSGRGVLKDSKEAERWFRRAADQGYADAQKNLALLGNASVKGNHINASVPNNDSGDGFPVAPPKKPGVTSCNTKCVNATCFRTYDDGRKVRFNARQVFDPLSNSWKFDSGSC